MQLLRSGREIFSRSFVSQSLVGPCSDRLKHWLLKKARVGSEDINHVYSPSNRSQEYWSMYILVKSFEGKKMGKQRWRATSRTMQGDALGGSGCFSPQGSAANIVGLLGGNTEEIHPGSTEQCPGQQPGFVFFFASASPSAASSIGK